MAIHPLIAFSDVGLEIFIVAWATLVILVGALVAASANSFFRNLPTFDRDVREATMTMSAADRSRFYDLYDARRPKSPAAAWFLAVGLGPFGTNLYRGNYVVAIGALVSLNGLGAWWLESCFTAPHLVVIENRLKIASAIAAMAYDEAGLATAA